MEKNEGSGLIEIELRRLGVLPKDTGKTERPAPDIGQRDVSWFKRGEECPH